MSDDMKERLRDANMLSPDGTWCQGPTQQICDIAAAELRAARERIEELERDLTGAVEREGVSPVDVESMIAAAHTRGWNSAIEAARLEACQLCRLGAPFANGTNDTHVTEWFEGHERDHHHCRAVSIATLRKEQG